MYYLGEF